VLAVLTFPLNISKMWAFWLQISSNLHFWMKIFGGGIFSDNATVTDIGFGG